MDKLGQPKTYTYDKAGRLTNATIGSNTYAYDYSAPTSGQCSQSAANLNSHKNSNRTSMTVNGVTTTYCYDYADRILTSSDTKVDGAQYDDHGNTVSLGTSPVTTLAYDSSDRNISITEDSKSTTYQRDVQNRIVTRTHNDGTTTTTNKYGFTSFTDSPDLLLDNSNNVVEKYLQLPGGVLLTIRPSATTPADRTYSLPNTHGDIFAATDAAGALLSTHTTGPFGEPISGQTNPSNTAVGSTFGWVGQHQKATEAGFSLAATQMGARVYIPGLGRFAQVDPIEGGVDNSYVYPPDPVNSFDLSGLAASCKQYRSLCNRYSALKGNIARSVYFNFSAKDITTLRKLVRAKAISAKGLNWSTDSCSTIGGKAANAFQFGGFGDACGRHDFGYRNNRAIFGRKSGDDRAIIDKIFRNNMLSSCWSIRGFLSGIGGCAARAYTVYGAVRLGGKSAYR